jgi:MFS family permease
MRWAIRILSLLGMLAFAAEAVVFLHVDTLWFLVAAFGDDPFQVALVLAAVLGIVATLHAGRRGHRGWAIGFVVLAVSSIIGPLLGPALAVVVAGDPALHAAVQRTFIEPSGRPRPSRAGEGSASLWRGLLAPYRRADGNTRLGSGADTHGANDRVRPSGLACAAVFGPGIPRL